MSPRVFDGQAYDRHLRPLVERFGERSGPVEFLAGAGAERKGGSEAAQAKKVDAKSTHT